MCVYIYTQEKIVPGIIPRRVPRGEGVGERDGNRRRRMDE